MKGLARFLMEVSGGDRGQEVGPRSAREEPGAPFVVIPRAAFKARLVPPKFIRAESRGICHAR